MRGGEKERSHIAVTRDGDDREKRMRRAPVCDAASIGSLGGQWAASLSLSLLSLRPAAAESEDGRREREVA